MDCTLRTVESPLYHYTRLPKFPCVPTSVVFIEDAMSSSQDAIRTSNHTGAEYRIRRCGSQNYYRHDPREATRRNDFAIDDSRVDALGTIKRRVPSMGMMYICSSQGNRPRHKQTCCCKGLPPCRFTHPRHHVVLCSFQSRATLQKLLFRFDPTSSHPK